MTLPRTLVCFWAVLSVGADILQVQAQGFIARAIPDRLTYYSGDDITVAYSISSTGPYTCSVRLIGPPGNTASYEAINGVSIGRSSPCYIFKANTKDFPIGPGWTAGLHCGAPLYWQAWTKFEIKAGRNPNPTSSNHYLQCTANGVTTCCAADQRCSSGSCVSCPSTSPFGCGSACCPGWCNGTRGCQTCSSGTQGCGFDQLGCCGQNKYCTNNQCCPINKVGVNTGCECKPGLLLCGAASYCCDPASQVCLPGDWNTATCTSCPSNYTPCRKMCCPPGQVCVNRDTGAAGCVCAPGTSPCNGSGSLKCCKNAQSCLPSGLCSA